MSYQIVALPMTSRDAEKGAVSVRQYGLLSWRVATTWLRVLEGTGSRSKITYN